MARFNFTYLFFGLLSTLSVVSCSTAAEDLIACRKACDDLIPRLHTFVTNQDRTPDEFDALSPFWTTCQYRCYRCHLPLAVYGMNRIQIYVNDRVLDEATTLIKFTNHESVIKYSIEKTCYNRWEEANSINDKESTFRY